MRMPPVVQHVQGSWTSLSELTQTRGWWVEEPGNVGGLSRGSFLPRLRLGATGCARSMGR